MGQNPWPSLGKAAQFSPLDFASKTFIRGHSKRTIAPGSTLLASLFILLLYSLWTFDLVFTRTFHESVPETESNTARGGVVIVTAASTEKLEDFQGIDHFYQHMWNNRMSYAEAHGTIPFVELLTVGYNFTLFDSSKFEVSREKHPVWCKLPAIAEAMDLYPSAKWVWWLDLDALIMTPHLDLYEYLLDPAVLETRLLKGEKIIPNDRIKIDRKALPELHTGEVHHMRGLTNVDFGPLGNRYSRCTRLEWT
jgi:hypothetical protein